MKQSKRQRVRNNERVREKKKGKVFFEIVRRWEGGGRVGRARRGDNEAKKTKERGEKKMTKGRGRRRTDES